MPFLHQAQEEACSWTKSGCKGYRVPIVKKLPFWFMSIGVATQSQVAMRTKRKMKAEEG